MANTRFDPVLELARHKALENAERLISRYEQDIPKMTSERSPDEITDSIKGIETIIDAVNSCTYDLQSIRALKLRTQPILVHKQQLEAILSSNKSGKSRIETLEICAAARSAYSPSTSITRYIPTILDILDHFDDAGQIGDDALKILTTLAIANRQCFGIEGMAGAGKTSLLDNALHLFPSKYIQVISLVSDKSLSYMPDISSKKILVFSELQKAASQKTIEEILKDLGEGKSSLRTIVGKDRNIRTMTIENEGNNKKAVVYTKAIENAYCKNAEFSRRYFVLNTDSSEEQTRDIITMIAQRQFQINQDTSDDTKLKGHLKSCLDDASTEFANPFAESLAELMPTSVMARSYCQHYFGLINASTRFHHPIRSRRGSTLFVNLQDVYLTHRLYHKQFMQSLECNTDNMNWAHIDWQKMWNRGLEQMRKYYPKETSDWTDSNSKNEIIKSIDPLSRTYVDLATIRGSF